LKFNKAHCDVAVVQQDIDTPIAWSASDVLELQYPPVWSSMFELANHVELQFDAFR
jgi:hypothetical protein